MMEFVGSHELRKIYEPLESSQRHIRLLSLQRPHTQPTCQASIELCLTTHSLDDLPEFDALSYAWGTSTVGGKVRVNKTPVTVTTNLYEALCMLSDAQDVCKSIWIDALCIDQSNISERNQQVPLMRDTYSKARIVHIWLGQYTSREVKDVLDIVPRIWRLEVTDIEQDTQLQAQINDLTDLQIHRLFDSPWWVRLWVLQEATVARNPIAHYGDEQVPFRELIIGCIRLLVFRAETILSTPPMNFIMRNLGRFARFYVSYLQNNNENVLELLYEARLCDLTNERDRIYGVLGLLPQGLGISVDYTISIEGVYEAITVATIRYSKSLDILALGGLHHTKSAKSSRSWIPWYELPARPSYIDDEDFDFAAAGQSADIANGRGYPDRIMHYERQGEMTVWGYFIDEIASADEMLPWVIYEHFLEADLDFTHVTSTVVARKLYEFQKCVRRCIDIFRITRSSDEPEADTIAAFWRDMVHSGDTASGLDDLEQFRFWIESETPAQLSEARQKMMVELTGSAEQVRVFSTVTRKMAGASRGMIKEGDGVAILAGASVPFILRHFPGEGKEFYQLIGYAFCNGIMHGEAFREAATMRNGSEENFEGIFQQITLI